MVPFFVRSWALNDLRATSRGRAKAGCELVALAAGVNGLPAVCLKLDGHLVGIASSLD